MIDADAQLAERFAALLKPLEPDWLDVRQRARRPRLRRLLLPLAAALAVFAVGSAFAVYRDVVDFGQAEPAPEPIMLDFNRMGVRASIELGPRVIPDTARKVTEATIDGKRESLYVAPTREGGFCWRWGTHGSCGRIHADQRELGGGWLEREHAPWILTGHILDSKIASLELVYEDGERVEIPTVWVSAPIDAGFYVHEVPRDRLRPGRRAEALVGRDTDGYEVTRVRYRYTDPRWESGPDGLPRIADRSQKRTLFDFRDHRGERWTLVVAPAPGDRLCYAYDGGGGCLTPKFPARIEGMAVQGGAAVKVCCAVSEGVTTVELHYEDGKRTELEPVDGFLLYVIPPEHYSRGHRIEGIVWRDAEGQEVARRTIDPTQRGVYPCAKEEEIELGYGQTICP
jgi:hypothetical protein